MAATLAENGRATATTWRGRICAGRIVADASASGLDVPALWNCQTATDATIITATPFNTVAAGRAADGRPGLGMRSRIGFTVWPRRERRRLRRLPTRTSLEAGTSERLLRLVRPPARTARAEVRFLRPWRLPAFPGLGPRGPGVDFGSLRRPSPGASPGSLFPGPRS